MNNEQLGSTPGLSPARDLATRWTWARACLSDRETTSTLMGFQSLARGAYVGEVWPPLLRQLRPWPFDNFTYAAICHRLGVPVNADAGSMFVYPIPPYSWYVLRNALSRFIGGIGSDVPPPDEYEEMAETHRDFRHHLHRIGSTSGRDMHGRPNMEETAAEFGTWIWCQQCQTTEGVRMYRQKTGDSPGEEITITLPYCTRHAEERRLMLLGAVVD